MGSGVVLRPFGYQDLIIRVSYHARAPNLQCGSGGFRTRTQHSDRPDTTERLPDREPLEAGVWTGDSLLPGRTGVLSQHRRRSSARRPAVAGACAAVVEEVVQNVVVR